MHILIVNTVMLNGGDAAITQATVDLLRAEFGPDTTFVVHESQARAAARYYPGYTFRPRVYAVASRGLKGRSRSERLRRDYHLARFRAACEAWGRGLKVAARLLLTPAERRLVEDFAAADVVVTSGGTYLVEHYDFTSRLFAIQTALRLRRPLVFFTQSLGPFAKPELRREIARVADRAKLVLLRDERSLAHLRDLGVRDDHMRVVADVVFAMADAGALTAARSRGAFPVPRADGGPQRVAISVREWSHFKDLSPEAAMAAYRDTMRAAVAYLVERYGARVTFVSTCQGTPEYWTDDARVAREIVEGLPEHVRAATEVNDAFHRPDELAALLRGFDLLVTTRLHGAILALGVGTLVFPVAYEFKTRELYNRLGLGEYVQGMEEMRPDAFVRTLGAFLDDAARVRETMFAGVERERQRALESGPMVRAALAG